MLDRSSPDRGPATVAAGRPSTAVASVAVGAILAIALYVAAFAPGSVHSLGSDAAGYVVQMRGASAGVFDFQGSRPGTAAASALLVGTGVVPAAAAPIVLSVALAATLGLAAAVALRLLAGVPAWASGVVVLIVATWGGTARLASGYLANLLSLTLFLLALIVALTRRSSRPSAAVFLIGVACFISHPALAPVYLVIGFAWVSVSLVRRGPHGRWAGDGEALATTLSLVGAALVVAFVVFEVLHLAPHDLADFTFAQDRFQERASDFLRWISPGLTAVMVLAGLFVCVHPSGLRTRAAASRLGISWLAVTAAGLGALQVLPSQPGHRTLLMGIPVPMLGALLVVGSAHVLIERIRPDGWRRAIASGSVLTLAVTCAVAIALTALRPFEARATSTERSVLTATIPEAIAGYLRSVRPERPVVLVANPASRAALRWKSRQNAVRAMAPDDLYLRTVVYLGNERKLLRGQPTYRHGPGAGLFNLASGRTWSDVEPVLDDDPIVLVVRHWVPHHAWRRVKDLATTEMPGVAVVRGPTPTLSAPVEDDPLSPGAAAVRIIALVVVLGSLGGGWSTWTLRGAPLPDRVAAAPAFGLCIAVAVAITVAIAGADPAGPSGVLAAVAIAGLGWTSMVPSWRARRRGGTASACWDPGALTTHTLPFPWRSTSIVIPGTDRVPAGRRR